MQGVFQGTVPELAWREKGKLREISVGIVCLQAEIRIWNLLITKQ
jgi:hypothetical protein